MEKITESKTDREQTNIC